MINTKQFALAGNATFTMTSRKSGSRFTYKIRKPLPNSPHFVKVLTGPNNESNYRFFGTIFPDGTFRTSPKSGISPSAPSVANFAWLWRNLENNAKITSNVEIHHEGKCCRCGRKLTVPRSIELGLGDECAAIMGVAF